MNNCYKTSINITFQQLYCQIPKNIEHSLKMHSDTEISYTTNYDYQDIWLNTFDFNTLQEAKVLKLETHYYQPYLTDDMKYIIVNNGRSFKIRFRETEEGLRR